MRSYRLLRSLLFLLPPETAHRLTHRTGHAIAGGRIEAYLRDRWQVRDERLAVEVFGQRFPAPLGVAAGFDKDARIPGLLGSLGFGHVEIGAVTARPQRGNPRPRLFRLEADEALINRMGFNNEGADRIARRLERNAPVDVPLGVNLGKTKAVRAKYASADYRYSYERLADYGDFFVINVSSPNTPGLRELQQREQLDRIVVNLLDAGASPLLVKLSPDLAPAAVEEAIDLVEERELDGIVATNTTIERPEELSSPHRVEDGGLSGRPLADRSTELIHFVAEQTDVPVVGVGGIFTAEDAYEKIRAGATLVQLYTSLIYRGPAIARDINRGLLQRLERDGFGSIEAAVGADLE